MIPRELIERVRERIECRACGPYADLDDIYAEVEGMVMVPKNAASILERLIKACGGIGQILDYDDELASDVQDLFIAAQEKK